MWRRGLRRSWRVGGEGTKSTGMSADAGQSLACGKPAKSRLQARLPAPPDRHRSGDLCHRGEEQVWRPVLQRLKILEALAERIDGVAGGLVLLDEVVFDTGIVACLQYGRDVDHAVTDFAECGLGNLLVIALL